MRSIKIPAKIQISKNSDELREDLKKFFQENYDQSFLFQCSGYGKKVFDELVKDLLDDINYQETHVGKDLEGNFDWIFSIGGGRALDMSKLDARDTEAKLAALPTLIAHDGICSPVAVVDGVSQGAIVPSAIFVDFSIIKNSPIEQIYAGIGDLVANFSALEDWFLANKVKDEPIDDFAVILSRRAAQSIISKLELNTSTDKKEFLLSYDFLHTYIESLVLSGISMSIAGNSRPCSGAEHLISHAIDEIYGANAKSLHGIQVMIATLYIERILNKDLLNQEKLDGKKSSLEKTLEAYEMPTKFEDIGIAEKELEKILELAPETRKGRFTLLDQLKTKA